MLYFWGKRQWDPHKDLFIQSICTRIINTALTYGTIQLCCFLFIIPYLCLQRLIMLAQQEFYVCPLAIYTPGLYRQPHWELPGSLPKTSILQSKEIFSSWTRGNSVSACVWFGASVMSSLENTLYLHGDFITPYGQWSQNAHRDLCSRYLLPLPWHLQILHVHKSIFDCVNQELWFLTMRPAHMGLQTTTASCVC